MRKDLIIGVVLVGLLVVFSGYFSLGSFSLGLYDVTCSDGGNKLLSCSPNLGGLLSSDEAYFVFSFSSVYDLNKDWVNAFGEVLKEDSKVAEFLSTNSACRRSGYSWFYKGTASFSNNLYLDSPIQASVVTLDTYCGVGVPVYKINPQTIENNLLGLQYMEINGNIREGGDKYGAIKGTFKTYAVCNLTSQTCNVSLNNIDSSSVSQPYLEPTSMLMYLEMGSISMQEACTRAGSCSVAQPYTSSPSSNSDLNPIDKITSFVSQPISVPSASSWIDQLKAFLNGVFSWFSTLF